jgi:methylated-DNA-[protein]-cysteine S-methyltransferase
MSQLADQAYQLLRQVPKGKITTYKCLAEALNTKAYQAIGQIMRRNPYAPQVPCHRVVRNNGNLGGFNGSTRGKNITNKIKLLKKEGIEVENGKIKDFEKKLWCFKT